MKKMLMSAALATAMLVGVPADAQRYNSGYNNGWNSNDFWRGAPSGTWERIRYLQDRINRGVSDGSLTRREADRAQYQLSLVRRDASRMRANGFSPNESASIQRRLDDLSRNIRWARHNGNSASGYGAGYSGNRDAAYYDRYRTDYDASRYYREGSYQERRLSANDEVYRGSDGRYYCKRSDGTTGLIVGAAAGGLLGNVVDGGHNRLAGTLIGGALGALAGKSIDQNSDVRCR